MATVLFFLRRFGLMILLVAKVGSAEFSCPNVLPSDLAKCPANSVNVVQYKICPGEFDNADNLISMRDRLIQTDPERHHIICFPYSKKPYKYSNNRWLNGLYRFTVLGNKATLQNIARKQSSQDIAPFGDKSIQQDWGDIDTTVGHNPPSWYVFHQGVKLASTAVKGSMILTVEKNEEIEPGDKILIASFAQQYIGLPLNARYFEWNEVTKVVGNAVTLKSGLKNTYDTLTWDFDYGRFSFGTPRIYRLRRKNFHYPEWVTLKDLQFLSNPHSPLNDSLSFSGRRVTLDGIVGDFSTFNVFTLETQYTEVLNSVVGGVVEVDKQSDQVLISHSIIKGMDVTHAIKSGTSCNRLTIKNNEIRNRVNVVCKELVIEDNTIDITGSLSSQPYWNGVRFYDDKFGGLSAKISGNRIKVWSGQKPIFTDLVERVGTDLQLQVLPGTPRMLKVWGDGLGMDSASFYSLMGLYPGSILYGKSNPPEAIAKVLRFETNHERKQVVVILGLLGNDNLTVLKSKLPWRAASFQQLVIN